MSEAFYDTEEGEFVDFETLDDWARQTREKDDHIKELEAKLEKAVEALDRIQDGSYGKLSAIARTTLAELKGKSDE